MTKADTDKKDLIISPKNYFAEQRRTLDERLNEIKLDKSVEQKIAGDVTLKIIRDKLLGLFKIGDLANAFFKLNDDIADKLKLAKKDILLQGYFEKNEENEAAVTQLKNLLTNPQGNTLFNKILRILDDSPPDLELMSHLASALKFIAESEFEKLFKEHRYALSVIEQLTPQALTILADHNSWPNFPLGTSTSIGTKITSDYLAEFAQAYALAKGIADRGTADRIGHSINHAFRFDTYSLQC